MPALEKPDSQLTAVKWRFPSVHPEGRKYVLIAGFATLLTYAGPVSNSAVTLTFKQAIGANEALRTGTYSKTLTFTLSTTTP